MTPMLASLLEQMENQPSAFDGAVISSASSMAISRIRKLESALACIAIVDQGCGGSLSHQEMVQSAMRQAAEALSE